MGTEVVENKEENEVEEEDNEEEEEGPPPGFHCPASVNQEQTTVEVDNNVDEDEEEDDEGPPPGWSTIPPSLPQKLTTDVEMLGEEEVDEDEDGPPPGWHLPQSTTQPAEACLSDGEDKEDGPPPGWELISPRDQIPLSAPTLTPSSIPDTKMGRKLEDAKCGDEGAQAGLQSAVASSSTSLLPVPPSFPSGSSLTSDRSFSEIGQLVCGSCRQLLSYPRGAKKVKCSCCQMLNLVLEAQQVGRVTCGSCAVLLMYSYGAPAVRCSSCRYVTEIGAHNTRPPLSAQQDKRLCSSNRVH